MRLLLLPFTLLCMTKLKAQSGIESLVQAERNFAAHSVDQGMKDAFLHFMDSNAVVFDKGNSVNALKFWTLREKRPGILNWHPQFAEISASGDFGYTTGPWTFQPETIRDSVVARGQFVTVWHKDAKGNWKFLVDLGTSGNPVGQPLALKQHQADNTNPAGDLAGMLEAEQDFINIYQKRPDLPYKNFLSKESMLNRNGLLPGTTKEAQQQMIAALPADLRLTIGGSGIAASGDLGFVYGTLVLAGRNENYLHIWRKEQESWKLALEVLRL